MMKKSKFILSIVVLVAMLSAVAWSAANPADLTPDYEFHLTGEGSYKTPHYSVGDYLWWDANENGLQDEAEEGVGGVEVSLFTSEGDHLASTLTTDAGQYMFAKILQWVPISGYAHGLSAIKFIILPVVVGRISGLGAGARWYRTLFLEEVS